MATPGKRVMHAPAERRYRRVNGRAHRLHWTMHGVALIDVTDEIALIVADAIPVVRIAIKLKRDAKGRLRVYAAFPGACATLPYRSDVAF